MVNCQVKNTAGCVREHCSRHTESTRYKLNIHDDYHDVVNRYIDGRGRLSILHLTLPKVISFSGIVTHKAQWARTPAVQNPGTKLRTCTLHDRVVLDSGAEKDNDCICVSYMEDWMHCACAFVLIPYVMVSCFATLLR